jgi:hypothetical protein
MDEFTVAGVLAVETAARRTKPAVAGSPCCFQKVKKACNKASTSRLTPAQILDKLNIIVGDITQLLPRQHWLNNGPHPWLSQPLGEAIQVGILALNQNFLRDLNIGWSNRGGALGEPKKLAKRPVDCIATAHLR